jgi:DNA polymerase-3 subunit epsilon
MRQIILDTETTGLSTDDGHRVIEIGCIELVDRRQTGQRFHCFLNPERDVDQGALEVHGLTLEKLRDQPRFIEVVASFTSFIRGAQLVIHNASFDVGFIDHELKLVGSAWGCLADYCTVLDTLKLARDLHPGQRNSLDALCKRYEVENAHRTLHGALLDAELLAEVYLAMTGGQTTLVLEPVGGNVAADDVEWTGSRLGVNRPAVRVIVPTEEERAAHAARLAVIDKRSGGRCVWLAETAPTDARA